MAYTVILHISGESAVAGEIEELPKPTDTILVVSNPRSRDGKDLHYLEANVVKVIWPPGRGKDHRLRERVAWESNSTVVAFWSWTTRSAWCVSSA
jgi:hypothetical protein